MIKFIICFLLLLVAPAIVLGQDASDADYELGDPQYSAPVDEQLYESSETEASVELPKSIPRLNSDDPDEYRIKIGDRFALAIYGEENTQRVVTVAPTGTIAFLYIPSFKAVGKTIEEFRHDLTEELKSYYKHPVLSMTAIGFNGPHYTILGDIINPGRKPIIGGASLLSALSDMGGPLTQSFRNFTIDVIDYNHSFLWSNKRFVPVDFERLIKHGDLSQNVPLKDGDYIHLASLVFPKIYVIGEVQRPFTLNYLGTKTLGEAIAEAGGVTRKASSRAVVIRGSLACPTAYYIDLNRILKAYACDFILQPGDILYVPPFRFWRLKEIVQQGIAAFVGVAASTAGTNTYLNINPAAQAQGVETPVPIIP